jgi:hypothetical protein
MKARSEVSGNEASNPPTRENFLPNEEIPTTSKAVIRVLINRYI